jgi:hypothetical protein
MLSEVYQITQLKPEERQSIIQIFNENENIFFEAIIPLMGQILLWQRLENKPNLNNLKLEDIFSFSQAKLVPVDRNILLQKAAKQLGCNLSDDYEITEAENEIRSHNCSWAMIRGKYVLWFFIKQGEAIWEASTSLLPRFLSKPKKRIDFGVNNAILLLGPRSRIPESLRKFVEQNYLSFIKEVSNS